MRNWLLDRSSSGEIDLTISFQDSILSMLPASVLGFIVIAKFAAAWRRSGQSMPRDRLHLVR